MALFSNLSLFSFPNGIDDPAAVEKAINNIPGIVENGEVFFASPCLLTHHVLTCFIQ